MNYKTLRIHIDEQEVKKEVSKIVCTESFKELQKLIKTLRRLKEECAVQQFSRASKESLLGK